MHSLISKLLHKRGIESVDKLDVEEKQTFEDWQRVLSVGELTIDGVKQFCKGQIDIIENKWKDLAVENHKKAELIPFHTCYKTLLSAIDAPKNAKEALERQLNQLLQ